MISNHSQPHQHTKQRDTVSLVLRALAVLLLLLIFLHGHGWAQGIKPTGNAVLVHFNGAPSGSCFSFNVAEDDTTGNFYDCFLGSWFQVNGTGGTGGSGTVTHTLGALTLNAFVLGNGGADIKTGTATTTNLSDVSATAATDGQLLIFDGPSSTYIPGDPKVQGLAADGATTVLNPVEIGGYDTAGTPVIHRAIWINGNPGGTEYGLVTRNIPSGTQTVSGTITANAGSGTFAISAATLPLPAGASTAAKQPALGTAGTASADVLSIQGIASMTPVKTDGSATTQPVSVATSVTVAQPTGTNLHTVVDSAPTTAITAAALPLPAGASTSANQSTVKAASTAAVATDTSSVVQISPNQPQLTAPLNTQGGKTNNNAAPGATNYGTLPALANAAVPSTTEGNQVALSTDLAGNLRVYNHPPNVLGCYMVNGRTGTYSGQAAGAPLLSFRWTSSTAFAVIMRVGVAVATTVVATVAGNVERELIIARSFTVSDTGGTAVTLTGNNQKMRTSQATSLVGDLRFGQPLTAGTRTLDAAPVSSVTAWLPTLFLGYDLGSGGSYTPVAATNSQGLGGIGLLPLLNATTGQDYPIVLAQNEGIIVRIGKDPQPTSATQQTYVQLSWCEVSAY